MNSWTFKPYPPKRGPVFILRMGDADLADHYGRPRLCYELLQLYTDKPDEAIVLFSGDDFVPSPLIDQFGPESVAALIDFLCLTPEDIGAHHFEDYDAEQMNFVRKHAEFLQFDVHCRMGVEL